MPSSSTSPTPTITSMNPPSILKSSPSFHLPPPQHHLPSPSGIPETLTLASYPSDLFPFSHHLIACPSPEDSNRSCRQQPLSQTNPCPENSKAGSIQSSPSSLFDFIDPNVHISSQFYSFNKASHQLMTCCFLENRLPTPDEIRAASAPSVLSSWRLVWKDRNEDTAFLTAWKRIQDKLSISEDTTGSYTDGTSSPAATSLLHFKSNPAQKISHVEMWPSIVASAHADPDLLRHLGLKDTLDKIRQNWTVGAKFYGIPESFVRVCVSSCPYCLSPHPVVVSGPYGEASILASKGKRRRFEYTETIELPAKDVPRRLRLLAAQHKVVLCIRQKYIRYKPFMAEVKDYACHRAGLPTAVSGGAPSSAGVKKAGRAVKREPYQSKRCGCGFRIRAIVPITNYNEKDKTFVYQDEGTAVFKMYTVHSGHEPGPLDGSARIVHRLVGHQGELEYDAEVYGVREDGEIPEFADGVRGNEALGEAHSLVTRQIMELRTEAALLEGRINKMPTEVLCSLSRDLADMVNRIRKFSLDGNFYQHGEDLLVDGNEEEMEPWGNDANHHLDAQDDAFCKDNDMIEEDDSDLVESLGPIVQWDALPVDCQDRKMLIDEGTKSADKWLLKDNIGVFVDKSGILSCRSGGGDSDSSKLIKPLTHDEAIAAEMNLVDMQVEGFYCSAKWYDSPGGLDAGPDAGDVGYQHGDL